MTFSSDDSQPARMLYPHILHETRCEHPDCADIPSWARDLAFLIDDSRETIMGNLDQLSAAVDRVAAVVTDLQTQIANLNSGASSDQAAIDALTAKLDAIAPAPAAPVAAPAATQTLYVHTDGNPFDSAQYVSAGTAPDGTPLFTFNGDLNPGDTTGVNADFAVYTA